MGRQSVIFILLAIVLFQIAYHDVVCLHFSWPSRVLGLSWQIGDETSKNLTTSFIETIFTERGKKSFINLFFNNGERGGSGYVNL